MKSPMWENIILKKGKDSEDIINVLKNVPIFAELTSKELKEVCKIIHLRNYKKNEPVFRMGDPGLGMYIIINGKIDIIKEDGKETQQQVLATLPASAFFGDMALLEEVPRSASAIAREDSKVIGFFRPDLLELMKRKPALGLKILFSLASVIGERLRKTNELLTATQSELEALKNG